MTTETPTNPTPPHLLLQYFEHRAFAAYYRSDGKDAPVPNNRCTAVVEHKGKNYIALRNSNGTLAVYRIKTDDCLKRLVRVSAALEADIEAVS